MVSPLLERGRTILGAEEHDAAVKDYLTTGGINLDPITKAWCASFVNSTLAQEGFPTAKANARSFENYGEPVLGTPRPGDIGVFSRANDPEHKNWQGHVAFSTGQTDQFGNPVVLSGNANDMVLEHPIDPTRTIGWRRPPGVQEPPIQQPLLSPQQQAVASSATSGFNNANQPTPFGLYPGIDKVGGTTTPQLLSLIGSRLQGKGIFGEQLLADIRNY